MDVQQIEGRNNWARGLNQWKREAVEYKCTQVHFKLTIGKCFHGKTDERISLDVNHWVRKQTISEWKKIEYIIVNEWRNVQTKRKCDKRIMENTDLLFSVSSSSLAPSLQHSSFNFLIREFWELSRPSNSSTEISDGKAVGYGEVYHCRWLHVAFRDPRFTDNDRGSSNTHLH